MKKITQEDLESLREHFYILGWNEEDIHSAIGKIKNNPTKHTVIMPKHYEKEAKLHASNHCEHVLGLKKGSKEYENAFAESMQEYLTDAYLNSTGIDTEGMKRQNPTTPRAVAAFRASVMAPTSPYRAIIKRLESSLKASDQMAAEKFRRSLKSGAMTLTHLYLQFVANLNTKQASFPDKGFVSASTSFQYLEKVGRMTPESRDEMLREIGQRNLMRGLILSTVLKVVEPIFRMNYSEVDSIVKTKLKSMPTSVYIDPSWLARFNNTLEFVIAKRVRDLDLKEIIHDTFLQVLIEHKPSAVSSEIGTAVESAQGITEDVLAKAKDIFMNKADILTPKENKERAQNERVVLKGIVPGMSFDFTDLMNSKDDGKKKKNPIKKAGPSKKVKKSKTQFD